MPENTARGFAWFVRPSSSTSPNDIAPPWGGTPVPRYAWPIGPNEVGVRNQYDDRAYVALTERPLPPEVREGWEVEPAALDSDFDTTGARMIREAGFRETPHGHIQECVFEVADA